MNASPTQQLATPSLTPTHGTSRQPRPDHPAPARKIFSKILEIPLDSQSQSAIIWARWSRGVREVPRHRTLTSWEGGDV